MSYSIKINDLNEFFSENKESILDLSYKNSININYSCKKGMCRSCIGQIIDGKISEIHESDILTEDEKNKGLFLACNSYPLANSKFKIDIIDNDSYIEPRTIPTKIDSIEEIYKNTSKFTFRTPPSFNLKFNPGQYLNLIKDDIIRSYSFFNSNDFIINENKFELIIKKYDDGKMSNYLFNEAKVGDLLRIEFPKGTFYLRNDKVENIIFLATGTGIAPVNSILSSSKNFKIFNQSKNIILIWGQKYNDEFFELDKNFYQKVKIYKIVSREKNLNIDTKIKHVQEFLFNLNLNLNNSSIYACGNINMINNTSLLLSKINFDVNNFYSDAFVESNLII
jgi:CDP-4-dehydro-6-deoxyglucose reductase